jgi:hypothetical protein
MPNQMQSNLENALVEYLPFFQLPIPKEMTFEGEASLLSSLCTEVTKSVTYFTSNTIDASSANMWKSDGFIWQRNCKYTRYSTELNVQYEQIFNRDESDP